MNMLWTKGPAVSRGQYLAENWRGNILHKVRWQTGPSMSAFFDSAMPDATTAKACAAVAVVEVVVGGGLLLPLLLRYTKKETGVGISPTVCT